MKVFTKILSFKHLLVLSAILLLLLNIFSFYHLYSNTLNFFRVSNYVLPFLSIVHFAYLYVIHFKMKEDEVGDINMRNLEYGLYAILAIYAYKFYSTFMILLSYGKYSDHMIPGTFFPIGILALLLIVALISATILLFKYRKEFIGSYDLLEQEHIDSWE